MKTTKPFYVMRATPSGYNTVCETRYGRWFASIDAAAALARRVLGCVYERRVHGHRLRLDMSDPATQQLSSAGGGWMKK